MNITLLGTSCMVPTKQRNVSGLHLEYNGLGILFDCGEGTQRQMTLAGLNRNKIGIICISHWHADHVAGILGLIQTISSREKDVQVVVLGPAQTKKRLDMLLNSTIHDSQVKLDVREFTTSSLAYENDDFTITCDQLNHVTPCLGFSWVQKDKLRINTAKAKQLGLAPGPEMGKLVKGKNVMFGGKKINFEDVTYVVKGKKFTYIADTKFCENSITLAQNADLLVAESTYALIHQENAAKYKHMTSTDAATIAKQANVKKLVLTHLSQRYKNPKQVLIEAVEVFENTELGEDFLKLKL